MNLDEPAHDNAAPAEMSFGLGVHGEISGYQLLVIGYWLRKFIETHIRTVS
jgi:hypothetical protein